MSYKKRKHSLAVLMGVILTSVICIVIILILLSSKTTTMPGKEIAAQSGEFLLGLNAKGVLIGDLECKDGTCAGGARTSNHSAWRVLAFASLAAREEYPLLDKRYREEVESYLQAAFRQINYQTQWQIYESYKLTRDPELLASFVRAMMYIATVANFGTGMQGMHVPSVMTSATYAREFWSAAEAYGNPATVAELEKAKQVESVHRSIVMEQWVAFFLKQGLIFYDLAEKEERKSRVITSWDPEIRLQSCWLQFANAARYKLLKDETVMDKMRDFFQRVSFSTHKKKDYDIKVLQMILPCIHALKELSRVDTYFEGEYRAALREFLIPNFDSGVAPICHGDSGFVVLTSQAASRGCNNVKPTADTSWAIHILADEEESFHLGGYGAEF